MPHKHTNLLLAIFTLSYLFLFQPIASASPPDGAAVITVRYYYYNACGACDAAGKFREQFYDAIGIADEGITVELTTCNTFQTQNNSRFIEECKKYSITKEKQVPPLLVINDSFLVGSDEIRNELKEVFLTEKAKVLAKNSENGSKTSLLLYFYVSPCDECAETKAFLSSLPDNYIVSNGEETFSSPVNIAYFNINESKNLETIETLFKQYNVPDADQKAPIIFLKSSYLSGKDSIERWLSDEIKSGKALGTVIPGLTGEHPPLSYLEWPSIFLAGVINGLNPCSVSMLLFLMALLLARNVSILKMGFSFIAGKIIAYIALGTVLFDLLIAVDSNIISLFQDIVKYILVIVAVGVAAMNLLDFFAAKHEKYNKIRMQLPEGLRRLNHRLMKRFSQIENARFLLLVLFALGLMISLGEFLCTGQIYLATILYLLKRSPVLDMQTFGAFLVYDIGMAMPPLALTLALWKGKEVYNLSEWARRNMPFFKIVNTVVFLIFGVILILT